MKFCYLLCLIFVTKNFVLSNDIEMKKNLSFMLKKIKRLAARPSSEENAYQPSNSTDANQKPNRIGHQWLLINPCLQIKVRP